MKAIVYRAYGSPDVLKLEEVEKPVPKEHQVQVRVHAVSINGSDWEGLRGKPLYARIGGLQKPAELILGSDIAGRVESIGERVTRFQPGDEVFGEMTSYRGGFAEYACVSEKALIRKPSGLTFEEAAAIPQGGVIALQAMREKGPLQPGQQVLINGAGGSAGTFAVQLARYYGAEVTGVDNAGKLEYIRSLGAQHVIDYTRQDFTRTGRQYDRIIELIARRSVFAYLRALKPGGRCLFVGGSVGTLFQMLILGPLLHRITGREVRLLAVQRNHKDLEQIAGLCEAGTILPVIDRRYPLDQVPAALRYVGEGRARGKVVITVV